MSSSHSIYKKRFFDFFPPPKFLQMPAAGLTITDQFIRFVAFKPRGHGLALDCYDKVKLQQGIVEGGFISDPKELISVLKAFKKQHGLGFVRASLPEEKSYLFKTQIPIVPEEEIRSLLEFKIQENVPVSPSEAVFDYNVIPGSDPKSGHFDVSVVVVPQKVVAAYTEVILSAGLTPLSFYTESQAITRSIVVPDDVTTSLVVHFRESKTIFFIVSHGIAQYASTLQVGGDALTQLIQKYFKISFEEAQKIKRQKVFSMNKQNSELFYSLVNELSVVKDEINKLVNYWRSYNGESKDTIRKIVLCGEDALLAGLDRYLSLNMESTVEVANVWANAFSIEDTVPALSVADSLNYVAAIGLALPE